MKFDNEGPKGHLLGHFTHGDCIRLVSGGDPCVDGLYIVAACKGGGYLAINLVDGCHRDVGMFVLEPNAKVVIE